MPNLSTTVVFLTERCVDSSIESSQMSGRGSRVAGSFYPESRVESSAPFSACTTGSTVLRYSRRNVLFYRFYMPHLWQVG